MGIPDPSPGTPRGTTGGGGMPSEKEALSPKQNLQTKYDSLINEVSELKAKAQELLVSATIIGPFWNFILVHLN